MRVCVLGAGVIGVTTAYFLSKDGHEVTVIDRASSAGLETSFANGGQISVSHSDPWASPENLRKVLRWLGDPDAPLAFKFSTKFRIVALAGVISSELHVQTRGHQ